MCSVDDRGRMALVARTPEGRVDEAKRAVAAKGDWVVNAVAVPHEQSAIAEAVAAAVAFILGDMGNMKQNRCLGWRDEKVDSCASATRGAKARRIHRLPAYVYAKKKKHTHEATRHNQRVITNA